MKEKTIIIKLTQSELDVLKQIMRNYLNLLSVSTLISGTKWARLLSKLLIDNGDKGIS